MATSAPNATDAAQALDAAFQENADRPSENRIDMKYEELRLTEDDRRNIDEMISLMAQSNILSVGLSAIKLKEIGYAIWGVHTFRLLEHTVTSEDLKAKIQTIFNYSSDWFNPLTYFLPTIKEQFFGGSVRCIEGNKEVAFKHLPAFAKAIGKEERTANLQTIMEDAKTPEEWDAFFKIVLDLA